MGKNVVIVIGFAVAARYANTVMVTAASAAPTAAPTAAPCCCRFYSLRLSLSLAEKISLCQLLASKLLG